MTGTPLVKNDTLFLKNVTIEVHSNNIILKYATAQFGQKLVSAIQEKAFFPLKFVNADKYWPPVARVDNVFGDRHLVCTCPPLESYLEAAE